MTWNFWSMSSCIVSNRKLKPEVTGHQTRYMYFIPILLRIVSISTHNIIQPQSQWHNQMHVWLVIRRSILAGFGNIFVETDHEIFSMVFLCKIATKCCRTVQSPYGLFFPWHGSNYFWNKIVFYFLMKALNSVPLILVAFFVD